MKRATTWSNCKRAHNKRASERRQRAVQQRALFLSDADASARPACVSALMVSVFTVVGWLLVSTIWVSGAL